MATKAEVLAYGLGIRLQQFIHLYFELTPANGSIPGYSPRADDYVAIDWLLRQLNAVFPQFAYDIGVQAHFVEMGRRLLVSCRREWKRILKQGRVEDEPFDDHSIRDAIDGLVDLVERLATLPHVQNTVATWVHLGREVCRGDWREYYNSEEDVLARRSRKPRWETTDPTRITELAARVGADVSSLSPDLGDDRSVLARLPFDPVRFEAWFRIELGLIQLQRSCEPPFSTQPEQKQLQSEHPQAKPGYLGLVLDRDRGEVRRGKICVPAPGDALMDLLELLVRNREVYTPYESINSSKDAAYTLKTTLRKFLNESGLGIRVQTKTNSGYRLKEETV